MNDTRLSSTDLDAAVDYAYGGAAVREGRKAQARTLSNLLRRAAHSAKAKQPEQHKA